MLIIDHTKCTCCQKCTECEALRFNPATKQIELSGEHCSECGLCMLRCKAEALRIEK